LRTITGDVLAMMALDVSAEDLDVFRLTVDATGGRRVVLGGRNFG
jgi:hypothetical protein